MISPEDSQLLYAPDIAPVRQFIQKAFQLKGRGDVSHYNHIIKTLKDKDDEDMLWKVLICLCSCVSQITSRPDQFRDLIGNIFGYNWNLEAKITIAHVNLISNIVSSNATFLKPSLVMLVRNLASKVEPPPGGPADDLTNLRFLFKPSFMKGLPKKHKPKELMTEYEVYMRNLHEKQGRIHKTIHGLIGIAPTGQPELYPILCDAFPYKKRELYFQVEFMKELFVICEYLPVLQYKILELIITKCLEIDVEIIIEDTGEVTFKQEDGGGHSEGEKLEEVNLLEADDDDRDDGLFSMDFEGGSSSNSGGNGITRQRSGGSVAGVSSPRVHTKKISVQSTSGTKSRAIMTLTTMMLHANKVNTQRYHKETTQKIADEVGEMAEKLDAMLVLVFQYIDVQFAKGDESADRIFHQLMGIFEEKILVIHGSKFVQYIMLYLTSKLKRYCFLFVRRILQLFYNENVSALIRQSALAYLASYLSRANFVPSSYIHDAVEELIQWSNQYVIDACADAIEYDDVIDISTSCNMSEHSPTTRGGNGDSRPSNKRSKHGALQYNDTTTTSSSSGNGGTTGHISVFASCRRIFEYSTRDIPHPSVTSPDHSNGNGTGGFENRLYDGTATASGAVPILPASTHWVKLDGRTHRHRKSLVNKIDDMQDLATKANDSIPCNHMGVGGVRTGVPTHEEMLGGLNSSNVGLGSNSSINGNGLKSSLKFIPNESCGNLADLFSNSLLTQGAEGNLSRSQSHEQINNSNSSSSISEFNSSPAPLVSGGSGSSSGKGIYASVNATSNANANRNLMKLTDLQQHETFYCCVQAAAYISCFHGVYLLHEHMCNESIRRQWECVLTATLNPLKYCLLSVKSEYLRLIELMEFLRPECWAIVQSSKANAVSASQSVSGMGSSGDPAATAASSGNTQLATLTNNLNKNPNPLGSFFPFDPCLLAKLNTTYVDSKYRTWRGIPGVDFDDDDGRYGSGGADRRNTTGTSITSDGGQGEQENINSNNNSHSSRRGERAGSNTSDCYSNDGDDSDRGSSFDMSDNDYTNYSAFSGTDPEQSDEGYESAVSGASQCESMSVSWLRDSSMPASLAERNMANIKNGPSTVPKLGGSGTISNSIVSGNPHHGPYNNNNYKTGAIPIKRRPRQPSIGSNVSTGSW